MGKFALIAKGARATKRVTVALDDESTPIACLVRPLSGAEETEALAAARAFAKARGIDEPSPADHLYQFGLWVHTILIGCRDDDATAGPYFDSAEQILEHLDRDRIALLYELQQSWQDECSPRAHALAEKDYVASILEIANAGDDDELPFERWQPGLRRSWVRTSARLLASWSDLKSPFGSGFAGLSASAITT